MNDLISVTVPHHTADDSCGDGRLGGHSMWVPPRPTHTHTTLPLVCVLSEGGGASIKAEAGCYLHLAEELSQIKQEVVKVARVVAVPPRNPPHADKAGRMCAPTPVCCM